MLRVLARDYMQTRDIIVIGSSMGGIEALERVASDLPGDLPAAVLIVQHSSEASPGAIADILARRAALRVVRAVDGMAVERGVVYVAPADRHLLVDGSAVRVVFGPRENRSRPAIDPLFRTAAVHYRSRVIGVVLTGLLGDGASGLRAIDRCGGLCFVQEPDDSAHAQMPEAALARVPTARRVRLAELGAALASACREAAPPPPPIPESIRLEAQLTERGMQSSEWNALPGQPTDYTCPECNGALRETGDEGDRHFRCRVGHAYSAEDLVQAKGRALEDALWLAMQTLEERVQMLESLAVADRHRGWAQTASAFEVRAAEARAHAERIRAALMELTE